MFWSINNQLAVNNEFYDVRKKIKKLDDELKIKI